MPLPLLKLPHNPANSIVRGDTWKGVQFTITKDGDPVDLTDCEAKITFRHPSDTWTIETGAGITITDAANGVLRIDEIQVLDVSAVVYKGDLQLTFPSGEVVTYLKIELTVTDDITK